MTTWARVQNGIVQELFELPPEWAEKKPADLFNPGIGEWLDVTAANPKPAWGWTYDGGKFAEPPEVEAGEPRLAWARKLGYNV